MDPVTHGLAGALLAEAGFRRGYGRQATVALVAGALIPDIDVLWASGRGVAALELHRGITHSLLGAAVLAVGVGAVARGLGPERRWGRLVGMAALGIGVGHLFLDLVTSFGIQLFLPFSRARPAWDWLFIIDLWFSVPLLLAVAAARVTGRPTCARLGCLYAAGYLALAALAHGAALRAVERVARTAGLPAARVAALPQPASPLRWLGLAETAEGYAVAPFHLLAGRPPAFETVPRAPASDLVAEVEALPPVQTYLWFARFPVVQLHAAGDRRVLEFRDLRFTTRGWREDGLLRRVVPLVSRSRLHREPFVLEVRLAPSGAVESVRLR